MSATLKNQKLDDRGTTPEEARSMLQKLRDDAFEGSDEKLSVAIGRPENELFDVLYGNAEFDDDLMMKTRGLAQQRGVNFE